MLELRTGEYQLMTELIGDENIKDFMAVTSEDEIAQRPHGDSSANPPAYSFDSGGNLVLLSGKYEEPYKIVKSVNTPENPLIIDGQNKTVLTKGLFITDCNHVKVQNLEINSGIEFNNSSNPPGLKGITLKNVVQKWASNKGFFMGAYSAEDITFEDCKFLNTLYGMHGVYFSGGHWEGSLGLGPCKNIKLIRCEIAVGPAGRHAIQFNGRFDGVTIDSCIFRNFQLCGMSLIGVQNAQIKNNISFGHNRGCGVVIFDYADSWAPNFNYFETQADIDKFNAQHHPCKNILIQNNTIIVGPKQFSIDPWHYDDPTKNHASIHVNNSVQSGFTFWNPNLNKTVTHPGWPFPNENIIILKNILWDPCLNIIDTRNPSEGKAVQLMENIAYSTKGGLGHIGESGVIGYLDKKNQWLDPEFVKMPEYDFVDLIKNPDYDWNNFKCEWDLYSSVGASRGIGASVEWKSGSGGDT